MRWSVFAITAFVLLVLQEGLGLLWSIPASWKFGGGQQPDLLLILAVYVALRAPAAQARWAALILGLLTDLVHTLPVATADATQLSLVGPSALGFLAAAIVVQELRTLLFRDSPLALIILVFLAGIFTHLVIVAMLTLRGVGILHTDPIVPWNPFVQLTARFWQLLYTTLVAIPLGALLARFEPFWNFPAHGSAGTRPGRARRIK